jgi:hypothetical protein
VCKSTWVDDDRVRLAACACNQSIN